jgi:hypothetical protein
VTTEEPGALESIAAALVESADPGWIIRIVQTMLADHKIRDTRVSGAAMGTELVVVVHGLRFGVWRPRATARFPAWDQNAEAWEDYKGRAVRSICGTLAHWVVRETDG